MHGGELLRKAMPSGKVLPESLKKYENGKEKRQTGKFSTPSIHANLNRKILVIIRKKLILMLSDT